MLCKICIHALENLCTPTTDAGTPRVRLRTDIASEAEGKIEEVERWIFGHHETEKSLTQSVDDGCSICGTWVSMRDERTPLQRDFFSMFKVDRANGEDYEMVVEVKFGTNEPVRFGFVKAEGIRLVQFPCIMSI